MDDGPFSKGYAFTFDDIWHQSHFQLEQGDTDLLVLPKLELDNVHKDFQPPLHFPDLNSSNESSDRNLDDIESSLASLPTDHSGLNIDDEQLPADVWTLDLELGQYNKINRLTTWEAFEKKEVPNAEQTAYLSEAGPQAFDAALLVQSKESSNTVLPQDVMLGALLNLALGRSSIFFQWNVPKKLFDQTLTDVPTSGLSLASHGSFVKKMIDCGSRYRALSDYASAMSSSKRSCTALVALRGCVAKILESIDRHVTIQYSHIRSFLQLQRLIDRPHQLLAVLDRFVDSVRGLTTDEEVITTISDQVHQIVCSENAFAETLQELLVRVSAPWLERLCADLELDQTGRAQSVAQFESLTGVPDDDFSVSLPAHSLGSEAMPGFVTEEDRVLIAETKKSLELLRQHVSPIQTGMALSPKSSLEAFRDSLPNLMPRDTAVDNLSQLSIGKVTMGLARHHGDTDMDIFRGVAGASEDDAWAGDDAQQNFLETLGDRMSRPLESSSQDHLLLSVAAAFTSSQDRTTSELINLSAASESKPLERLRPLIQSHAASVNRTLLRHLFWQCRLRHHLDLQQQFHLFGNGDFVSRLVTALFSTDTQSAERKRGRIPTGETMGLRLGARDGQNWPPASSEIQLTLMGILTETYRGESSIRPRTAKIKELPGGLSFSVRELPEKEIEKVMDVGSIYALDFLKLQYTPSQPLTAILTPPSLRAYDDMFRFLLRLLRVHHVTKRLHETHVVDKDGLNTGSINSFRAAIQFAIEAHHCMSILMSHFMDVGIAAKWNRFQSSLASIETALDSDEVAAAKGADNVIGLDGLRQLHEACLEGMRARLFLRRKQQKLSNGIENILTAILKCAASLDDEETADSQARFTAFKTSLTNLLNLLRAAADKPLNAGRIDETTQEDAEAMRILLLRLDWNGYYGEASRG